MKKVILSSFLLLFSFLLLADEPTYFNLREGKSSLITEYNRDQIIRLYRGTRSLNTLKNIMFDPNSNRCATKIVSEIKSQLNLRDESEVKIAILGLRLDDAIDDITANILIKASLLHRPFPQPIARNNISDEEESKALSVFRLLSKDFKDKSLCIEDSYRVLVKKLIEITPNLAKNLKHMNKLTLNHEIINDSDFKKLETMRTGKIHEWPITLSEHAENLEKLSRVFPDRVKESSDFISNNIGKLGHKNSLRQSLFERYNSTQIIQLANMVKELKKRMEAQDITIVINYVDQPSEVINLSPLEKFRFLLKALRKELATLNNSSMLNGNTATYIDLITASYEVGYIGSNEIKELSTLEDIWNPKKTPKQKVLAWGQRFGGIASVLLPPPFGAVSLMAIMLIDQFTPKSPVNSDLDYNIF